MNALDHAMEVWEETELWLQHSAVETSLRVEGMSAHERMDLFFVLARVMLCEVRMCGYSMAASRATGARNEGRRRVLVRRVEAINATAQALLKRAFAPVLLSDAYADGSEDDQEVLLDLEVVVGMVRDGLRHRAIAHATRWPRRRS